MRDTSYNKTYSHSVSANIEPVAITSTVSSSTKINRDEELLKAGLTLLKEKEKSSTIISPTSLANLPPNLKSNLQTAVNEKDQLVLQPPEKVQQQLQQLQGITSSTSSLSKSTPILTPTSTLPSTIPTTSASSSASSAPTKPTSTSVSTKKEDSSLD